MPHLQPLARPLKLYPFQSEAIDLLRSKKIHLALTSPTGSGKGVILETLALNPAERILVLTPLIALGRQQLRRFEKMGIPSHATIGGESSRKWGERIQARVWISSPEAALNPKAFRRIEEWKPTLIAVDEAHCLQEWGESFRPAYHKIPDFIKALRTPRTLWMSATFPRATVDKLKECLAGDWEVRGKFAMPKNLRTTENRVSYSERIETVRLSVLAKKTPGLIFAGTRKNVENYTTLFHREGRAFFPYHAGMADEERRSVEKNLESHSIIATNAFGMGMDYSHLEWVILAQAPFSLLGLMQSLGRVARGTRKGDAEIYWAEEDFRIAGYLIRDKHPESKESKDLELLRRYFEANPSDKAALLEALFI